MHFLNLCKECIKCDPDLNRDQNQIYLKIFSGDSQYQISLKTEQYKTCGQIDTIPSLYISISYTLNKLHLTDNHAADAQPTTCIIYLKWFLRYPYE